LEFRCRRPGNADHDDLLDFDRFYEAFDSLSGELAADTRDDCHDWRSPSEPA